MWNKPPCEKNVSLLGGFGNWKAEPLTLLYSGADGEPERCADRQRALEEAIAIALLQRAHLLRGILVLRLHQTRT